MTIRSRAFLVGAGLLALVLVAAVSVLVLRSVYAEPEAPEAAKATVSAYFDALADRDAERARSLLVIAAEEAEQYDTTTLLTAATLRDDGYTPPRQIEIGGVTTELDQARVEVSFQAGRGRQTLSMPLTRHNADGTEHGWLITGGLSVLEVPTVVGDGVIPTGIDAVVVAGTRVPYQLAISSPYKRLEAFPGEYVIAIEDHPVLECVPVPVAAGTVPENGLVIRPRDPE